MRNILTSFLLLLLFIVNSGFTNGNKEKLLIGKWKIDGKAARESYEKLFEPGDNPQADAFAKGMVEYLLVILENTVSEYKENGEVIYTTTDPDGSGEEKIRTGTWKLSNDKKFLIVTEKNKETQLEIISLSKEKMELAYKDLAGPGKELKIIFYPVK